MKSRGVWGRGYRLCLFRELDKDRLSDLLLFCLSFLTKLPRETEGEGETNRREPNKRPLNDRGKLLKFLKRITPLRG